MRMSELRRRCMAMGLSIVMAMSGFGGAGGITVYAAEEAQTASEVTENISSHGAEGETAAETVAETAAETTVETVAETAPETTPETAAETTAETTVETVAETVLETPEETAAETSPETAAETAQETAAPETEMETVAETVSEKETPEETDADSVLETMAETTDKAEGESVSQEDLLIVEETEETETINAQNAGAEDVKLIISQSPEYVVATPGEKVELSVTTAELQGISYQWRKNGIAIASEADGPSYTIESLDKTALYTCYVSIDTDEFTKEEEAHFDVRADSGFFVNGYSTMETTENWEYVTVKSGASVKLTVNADVKYGSLYYQWEKNGVAIEDETTSTYSIPSAEGKDYYCCRVTDDYGNYFDAHYDINIDNGLKAEATNTYAKVPYGGSATFSVLAEVDQGGLTYHWYRDDVFVDGATGAEYTALDVRQLTRCYCVVSDDFGNTEYVHFYAEVDTGLSVDGHSSSFSKYETIQYGENLTLTVNASINDSMGDISYRWADGNGQLMEDVTSNSCALSEIKEGKAIYCVVSDGYGNEITVSFYISVDSGLTIDGGRTETDIEVHPGASADLTVYATTYMDKIAYSWSVWDVDEDDYLPLEGMESTLHINNVNKDAEYRCIVSDGVNEEYVFFNVTIDNDLTVEYTGRVNVVLGKEIELTVTASVYQGNIHYRWQKDNGEEWEDITGKEESSLTIIPQEVEEYYCCVVTDDYGNQKSAWFTVVATDTLALNYKENYSVLPGSDVSLSVTAVTVNPPVSYQWYQIDEENGWEEILLEGKNEAVLELQNMQKNSLYRCSVQDAKGDTAEAYIPVYMDSGLALEYEDSVSAEPGDDVTLTVNASSQVVEQDKITYQWSRLNEDFNYEEIPGETANSLVLTNVQRTGEYRCEVRDSFMTMTADFTLTIETGFSAEAEQSAVAVKSGETATVKINASVDKGTLKYEWETYDSDYQYVTLPETGNTVSIPNVTEDLRVHCTVSDEYGNSKTVTVRIKVIGETAPDFASAVELNPGESKLASVAELSGKMYFKIVPETSKTYVFSSVCGEDDDPYGYLYDAYGNLLEEDDDGGGDLNFRISYYLEAGKTYYLAAAFLGSDIGSYYVTMTREGETVCVHEWEYINVKAPTCTAAGTRTPRCTKCGLLKEAETYGAALGHSAGAWKVTKNAACTATGQRVQTCTRCGDTVKTETIAALGHSAGAWKVTKNATCTASGQKAQTCTRCGGTVITQTIPAAGHKFSGWTVKSKATVFAAEVQTRKCMVCGNTQTRTVGSKLKPTIAVSATTIPLKTKQSTTKLKVSGLAAGDKVVSWKSSNTKIATVNSSGKITAKNKTGKANITITLASGLTKKVTVKVQKTAVTTTKISGLKKKVTLAKGSKLTLSPVITPITSTQKVTYSSSNKKVVTVTSKGVIKAKSAGTAKITVKSGTKKFTVTVTVPKTKTKAITGVPASLSLKKGKTYKLKAKRTPSGSDEKLTYKSSNSKVATVNASGKITAKKKGKATITVKSGKISVKCKVTVK